MKMINTAPHPLNVPGNIIDDRAFTPQPGKLLVKPERITIPVGAVVEIDPAFALRRRGAGGEMTSVAYEATNGMLQPYGPEAMREARLFVDQHATVQLRQVEMRERSIRENPGLYVGIDLATSQQSETERVATMLGMRQLQTMRELREPEAAQPTFEMVGVPVATED